MTPTTNHGTDIQCVKCRSYIFHNESFIEGYDGKIYHPHCFDEKRMELETEYVDEYNSTDTEKEFILKMVAIEYSDIFCDNILKKVRNRLNKQ